MLKLNKTDKEFFEKFNIQCHPYKCPYFPDMNVHEFDKIVVVTDEKGNQYKQRNTKKVFKCLYDNHVINWTNPCPYEIDGTNKKEE